MPADAAGTIHRADRLPPFSLGGRRPGQAADGADRGPTGPKRIAVGILGAPPTLWDDLNPGTVPGASLLKVFVTAGLAVQDEDRRIRPQLAISLPSTDDGSWVVFPDGRMETRWRIRDRVRWHDGTPFTVDDLVFSLRVAQNRDLEVFNLAQVQLVESVEAADATTVVVRWRQAYIGAEAIFASGTKGTGPFAPPLPKHLLEGPLQDRRAAFLQLPYWGSEFVSTGPFKVREWSQGSYALLNAFDQYALGRPKLDQIEIRFIGDSTTMVANVLAGALDLTPWRGITIEQGLQVRDLWRDGTVTPYQDGWTMMYPQLRAPTPIVLGEAQFRRALMLAIDRDELAESLTGGFGGAAHSIIRPSAPEFQAVESSIVRLPYDPSAALRAIEALGYPRGTDGQFRDSRGERLSVEIRTTANDANQKAMFAVGDYWTRIGVAAEPLVIPNQRLQEPEYRATYPGVELVNQPDRAAGLENLLHSSAAPLPERGYRAPNSNKNRGAYLDPSYDALMDRYRVTVPLRERFAIVAQLVGIQTDRQLVMGLFYSADAILIANRVKNVPPASSWNSHEWELR